MPETTLTREWLSGTGVTFTAHYVRRSGSDSGLPYVLYRLDIRKDHGSAFISGTWHTGEITISLTGDDLEDINQWTSPELKIDRVLGPRD